VPRAALSEVEIREFRQEICAVATRLFAEQGYAGVTLRSLAAELGCSPMTPYRYFSDKEAIFAAVRSASFGRFADAQEAAAAAADAPEARLRALAGAYVRFALDEPHAYRIMFELDQTPEPDDADQLVEETRAWQALRETVGAAVEAGLVAGDPDTLAHLYWAGLHGLVSLHLAGKLRLGCDLTELVDPMLGAVLSGTRAPNPDPGANP
jgi:AcrR family transcriptional regulator